MTIEDSTQSFYEVNQTVNALWAAGVPESAITVSNASYGKYRVHVADPYHRRVDKRLKTLLWELNDSDIADMDEKFDEA